MNSKLLYQKTVSNVTKVIASLCVFVLCTGCQKDLKDLDVSVKSIEFPYSGGEKLFDITSNTSWTVSSSVSWLTFSPTTGSDNETIEVTAFNNTTTSSRMATITISGEGASSKIINVNQAPSPPKAFVRFRKEGSLVGVITAIRLNNTGDFSSVVQHNFHGTGTETSSYYEVTPGSYRPSFYFTLEGGLWLYQTDFLSYNFQAGHSYTVINSGTFSVTVDQ